MQIFTKTPNQWREPQISDEEAETFRAELARNGLRAVVSHDSYLINLASPDRRLRARSLKCFKGELLRCRKLGVAFLVTHPGNFMTRRDEGMKRNARAYAECLGAVPGPIVLLETTAGTGTALGSHLEELAQLRSCVPTEFRSRIGFCADTCHLYSAGYDLRTDWNGVWRDWERILGLESLRCIHLNDSKTPFNSHRDRHELISEGSLGAEPFRRVMQDPRFAHVIKIIETPKGDDGVKNDRKMLRRLRSYTRARRAVTH